MKAMEDKIRSEAHVLPGEILLVDAFLNQQVDVALLQTLADAWYERFGDRKITKILTIEASGIAIASIVAARFGVPALFAKKYDSHNLTGDRHETVVYSYTKCKEYTIAVSRRLLTADDHVLIVDDFLANGCALTGLIELVESAGATVAGIGIAIEKTFQPGGHMLREQGYEIYSMAQVKRIDVENDTVEFEPVPIIRYDRPEA